MQACGIFRLALLCFINQPPNTALMKKQWGQNLIKFEGLQLPGGVTMNGRQMYDDAKEELDKIGEEMQLRYELPVDHLIG